jgi:hypothetical protein
LLAAIFPALDFTAAALTSELAFAGLVDREAPGELASPVDLKPHVVAAVPR